MKKPGQLKGCTSHSAAKKAAQGRAFAVYVPLSPISATPERARVGLARVMVALKAAAPATPGVQVNQQNAVPLYMMAVRSTHLVHLAPCCA